MLNISTGEEWHQIRADVPNHPFGVCGIQTADRLTTSRKKPMKPITYYIDTHRTRLLAEEFGAYLQRLEDADLLTVQCILTLAVRETVLGNKVGTTLSSASNQFPYTLTGRQVRAIAMLRGSSDSEMRVLLCALSQTLLDRQMEKAPA